MFCSPLGHSTWFIRKKSITGKTVGIDKNVIRVQNGYYKKHCVFCGRKDLGKMSELAVLKRRIMKLESMLEVMYDELVTNKLFCPLCENEVRIFLPTDGGGAVLRRNAVCPVCDSDERTRMIYTIWQERKIFNTNKKIKLLHIAPEKQLVDKFNKMENIQYYACDLNKDMYGVEYQVDITDIPFEENMFDVIMCSNVIEHVQEDRHAMEELYRVLKKGGIAFIDVPVFYDLEKTLENLEGINTPELQKKVYGWEGHVRKYGRDYKQRLESVGFQVEEITIKEIEEKYARKIGVLGNDLSLNYRIHLCRKL